MSLLIARVLQLGVGVATALVLVGGVGYLIAAGGQPPRFAHFTGTAGLTTIGAVLAGTLHGDPRALIQLGLLLLILTPLARVVLSLASFAAQRDRLYVTMTLIVLCVLAYSISDC